MAKASVQVKKNDFILFYRDFYFLLVYIVKRLTIEKQTIAVSAKVI